MNPFRTKRCN